VQPQGIHDPFSHGSKANRLQGSRQGERRTGGERQTRGGGDKGTRGEAERVPRMPHTCPRLPLLLWTLDSGLWTMQLSVKRLRCGPAPVAPGAERQGLPQGQISPFLRRLNAPFLRFSVSPFLRFSVSPFLRFSVSPFLRFSVSPFLRFSVSSTPPSALTHGQKRCIFWQAKEGMDATTKGVSADPVKRSGLSASAGNRRSPVGDVVREEILDFARFLHTRRRQSLAGK